LIGAQASSPSPARPVHPRWNQEIDKMGGFGDTAWCNLLSRNQRLA
jgi:hypothetical protein